MNNTVVCNIWPLLCRLKVKGQEVELQKKVLWRQLPLTRPFSIPKVLSENTVF